MSNDVESSIFIACGGGDNQLVSNFSVPMISIKPAHSYNRKPPNILNLIAHDRSKLSNFLKVISQHEVFCPIEGVFIVKSCFIYEAKFVLSADKEWLPSTVADFSLADHFKSVLANIINSGSINSLEDYEHPTFLIAKAGSGNYGHLIAEILPKIINIKKIGIKYIRLLMPDDMRNIFYLVDNICKFLGIIAEIRTMSSAELLHANNIHVMSPVSQHDSRKSETFLELRDVLLALYDIKIERQRSIFIRRGPNDSRKIINAAETEETFIKYGFEPVYPASLNIPDQIRLFATADRVAGTLGAGLSNTAFASQECDVLMIDPGLGDYFFWDFACLLQQNFTWLFSGNYVGYEPNLAEQDFSIDNALLCANLRSVYA